MKTEQTSEKMFTYVKIHYSEAILARIRELEKNMIEYSYANHLQFCLRYHYNNIQRPHLKSRIKTE